jgi:hypothetical protein
MTSTSTPAFEVARALIAAFRADPIFMAPGGLLFPTGAPRIDGNDDRVYSNQVEFPEDPAVVEALPRIMFEVRWEPHGYEQDAPGVLDGPVMVYLHVLVARDQEQYGEALVAASILKVRSTQLSGARMIAAELVPTTGVLKDRVSTFKQAWEWIAGFRSQNVEVLA